MRSVGAALILLASLALGLGFAREKKRRLTALRELCAALELLAAELEARGEPLPRICERLGGCAPGGAGAFFRRVSESLPFLGERSFSALWTESLEQSYLFLKPQERQELQQLGSLLGRYELSRQLAGIRRCQALLELERDSAQAGTAQEQKLGIGLSLAAGLLLTLALF